MRHFTDIPHSIFTVLRKIEPRVITSLFYLHTDCNWLVNYVSIQYANIDKKKKQDEQSHDNNKPPLMRHFIYPEPHPNI